MNSEAVMSFSHVVKRELGRLPLAGDCCAIAEAFGVLLYCNTFTQSEIRIITGSRGLSARLPRLFRFSFGVRFDYTSRRGRSGKRTFLITAPGTLRAVFETCGLGRGEMLAHHINFALMEDDCCRQSFLRGVFEAGGSVTDPSKRYHLELVTDHHSVGREMRAVLQELGFDPKETTRGGNYVTYFKQSEAIEDFLTTIGAPVAAMALMSTKIEKDMRNSVQRRVNCDTGNVSKTVDAAQSQIDAIRRLGDRLPTLPEKLRRTAEIRLENPELSLAELAELFDPPVTKSGLNHRLRKLVELGQETQAGTR